MKDRPKVPAILNDLLLDQRVTYLYNEIKKLKADLGVATATRSSGSGSSSSSSDRLRWRGEVSLVSLGNFTVDSKDMPWAFTGGINSGLTGMENNGTSPEVVVSNLEAGASVVVTYVSGTVSVEIGVQPYFDAAGNPSNITGDTVASGRTNPTKYMAGLAKSGVNTPNGGLGAGGLCGAFTDSSGVVVKPVAIGLGATLLVPAGATRLQLGINDNYFADNDGSFTVSVSTVAGASGGYKINDVIAFRGHLYVAIADNPSGVLPPNATYWVEMTELATSSQDGLAPQSPGDATKFLNGAATPAYALVKDSDLSLSDITTNNVGTTKHGFAPKAPGDATKFLNGANPPAYAIAIPTILVNYQGGTSYTFVTGDKGKLVTFDSASAKAVTLPQAGSVGFESGWFVYVQNFNGDLTITPTTSTIDGSATLVLKSVKGALLVSDGTNYRQLRVAVLSAGNDQNVQFKDGSGDQGFSGSDNFLYNKTSQRVDIKAVSGTLPTALRIKNSSNAATVELTGDGYALTNVAGLRVGIGGLATAESTYGAIYFTNSAFSSTNYAFAGSSTEFILNGPSGGTLALRIGGTEYFRVGTGANVHTVNGAHLNFGGNLLSTVDGKTVQCRYFTDRNNNVAYVDTAFDSTHAWLLDNRTSSKIAFTIRGAASQSTRLLEFRNSADNVLGGVDQNGLFQSNGVVYVTSNFSKTSDTALADVTGLSVTLVAGKKYKFRAVLFVDADTVGGHKYAINHGGNVNAIEYNILSLDMGTSLYVITSRQTAEDGAAGQAGATTILTIIEGYVDTSTVGGFKVRFAQNAASGTSTIRAGSHFSVMELS